MKKTEEKFVSPSKQVKANKRAAFKAQAWPVVFKLLAGVAIVAASYSSIYRVLLDLIVKHPEYFATGIAAVAITILVIVLAYFDTK